MLEVKTGLRIILADGSVYENATAGYAEGILTVFLRTVMTMQEAATVFFDTGKTATIVFEYGEKANEDVDHNVTVSLRRET